MNQSGKISGTCDKPQCGQKFVVEVEWSGPISDLFSNVICPHCKKLVNPDVGKMYYCGANTWGTQHVQSHTD